MCTLTALLINMMTGLSNPMVYLVLTLSSEVCGVLRFILPQYFIMFCIIKVTIDIYRETQLVLFRNGMIK